MSWSYRPALDGLRTIAVYLVLLFHTGVPVAGGGFVGVDLFFVLSGFLVSNVILSEIDRTGTLRIGKFYSRRVRRLLPAAVAVVVATCAVFVLISSVTRRLPLIGDAQAALLYVANWRFLAQSSDYFATDVEESPFLHFWSLAIEEQFYFVFPILLLLLTKASRRWGWALLAALGALFALSLGSQLYWAQVDTNHAYYGTDARLYQLLAGVLLTVALRTWHVQVRRRTAELLAVGGLVLLLVLGSGLPPLSPSWRGIGAMVASVLLIAGLSLRDDGVLARGLARPVPVFLGRISYGTYLWHWPVILVLEEVLVVSPKIVAVLTVGVATGLAAASYEVLEMPIRKNGFLDRFQWNTAVTGVAVSALVAVTLVPWALQLDRKPALAALDSASGMAGVATGKPTRLPADVDWAKVEDDIGGEGSCSAADVARCTVVDGSGPHVLLVGDSQAQMLVPMFESIAEQHGLRLSLNVQAGCPWQEGLANKKSSDKEAQKCEAGRVGWYDEVLPELDPDVVVLVSRPRDEPQWARTIVRRDGREQPLEQMTAETSRETLAKVEKVADDTVLVERMIMPETFDPDECLTSASEPSACAVPVPLGTSPTDAFYIAEAAEDPALHTVDLNPAFCPGAPVCQPVVGGEIVWRDDHHVTAQYAVSRRDQVWRLLEKTGVFGTAG